MPRRTDCTDRRVELFQADGLRRGLPVRLNSGAALPTVVGLLVEVSVMLWVVSIVKSSRSWYERAAPAR